MSQCQPVEGEDDGCRDKNQSRQLPVQVQEGSSKAETGDARWQQLSDERVAHDIDAFCIIDDQGMEATLTAFFMKPAGQRVESGEKLASNFGADGFCNGERCAPNPQQRSKAQQIQQNHRPTIDEDECRVVGWQQRIEHAPNQEGNRYQNQRLQNGSWDDAKQTCPVTGITLEVPSQRTVEKLHNNPCCAIARCGLAKTWLPLVNHSISSHIAAILPCSPGEA